MTRGKTALNRLRQVDVFVALAHAGALRVGEPLVVDVGYGAYPWTALEMRDRWRRINPALRLLGVEIDRERVEAAQPFADEGARFVLGGFNLPAVLGTQRARVVRCYNVLRQYDEAEVVSAMAAMAGGIEPGGLLVEGTSDQSGRMVSFDVYRMGDGGLVHEVLVFGTNFRAPVEPADFQTILPKRLIHHMLDDAPAAFFADWRRAFDLTRVQGVTDARARWASAATLMRERFDYPVDTRKRIIGRGYLAISSDLR